MLGKDQNVNLLRDTLLSYVRGSIKVYSQTPSPNLHSTQKIHGLINLASVTFITQVHVRPIIISFEECVYSNMRFNATHASEFDLTRQQQDPNENKNVITKANIQKNLPIDHPKAINSCTGRFLSRVWCLGNCPSPVNRAYKCEEQNTSCSKAPLATVSNAYQLI